jgi:ADP-heptose:LPS heptosyltransferase
LLVRLDNIGDFVLWLDAAKYLRCNYPGRHIVLIANAAWADLATCFPYWDEVWPLQLKAFVNKPIYRWSILRRVFNSGFEIAMQPTFSRVLLHGDSLIRASKAVYRIGSESDLTNISTEDATRSNRWYTQLIQDGDLTLMELERNAEFLKGLGIAKPKPHVASIPRINVDITPFRIPEDYFVICPGASNFKRIWPIERFAEIARYVYDKTGWTMVICGSKNEAHLAAEVIRLANIDACNLTGIASLPEFVEVVRGSRILIGNETASTHIAASVQVESVCILGGGHFGRFMPYSNKILGTKPCSVYHKMNCFNCNWRCSQDHDPDCCWPCISAVSVESVQEAVNYLIGKTTVAS